MSTPVWVVESIADGQGTSKHKTSWYIRNTRNGRTKRVGPVTLRGMNWYDRAQELADERNKAEK